VVDSGITYLWTFDNDTQGWGPDTYGTVMDDSGTYDPNSLQAKASFDQDNADGHPKPPTGELTITVPFSAYNQKATFQVTNSAASWPSSSLDLTNQVLSFWMKIDKNPDGGAALNTDPSCPAGVVVDFKNGTNYNWIQAGWANLPMADSQWHQYTLDTGHTGGNTAAGKLDTVDSVLDGGTTFNQVDSIGFFIHTGGGNIPADAGPDAQSACAPPSPVTIHIDSVGIQPSPQ
jgi:hypothetical protein